MLVLLTYILFLFIDVITSFNTLDISASIASRFHITKYPTLKLLRNGQASKREYRGQRSAEAFASFIKEQLKDPIKEIESLEELNNIEVRF